MTVLWLNKRRLVQQISNGLCACAIEALNPVLKAQIPSVANIFQMHLLLFPTSWAPGDVRHAYAIYVLKRAARMRDCENSIPVILLRPCLDVGGNGTFRQTYQRHPQNERVCPLVYRLTLLWTRGRSQGQGPRGDHLSANCYPYTPIYSEAAAVSYDVREMEYRYHSSARLENWLDYVESEQESGE